MCFRIGKIFVIVFVFLMEWSVNRVHGSTQGVKDSFSTKGTLDYKL